jgi:membrane protein
MTLNARGLWALLSDTFQLWLDHRCFSRAAALAYYAAFSLAPILVIVIALAGAVWGRDSVEGHLVSQFDGLLGPDGAKLVQQVVRASYLSPDQSLAALVGVLGTLFGASALFTELSDAVQSLFAASRQYRYAWLGLLMERLLGLALVVGLGFLLLVSLTLSAGMVVLSDWLAHWGALEANALRLLQTALSWGLLSALFTLMLRVLAPVKLASASAWLGGMVTATLFEIGKWAVGLYLGHSTLTSVFGAAGTLAVTLVWLNYAALTVLFGVAFTSQWHGLTERTQWGRSERPVHG